MTKVLELQSSDQIRLYEAYPLQCIEKCLPLDHPNPPQNL